MSTAKVHPTGGAESKANLAAYRAVPLSTQKIVLAITTLSIFSFLYLGFAQRHALLFYLMTGLIGVFILVVYGLGIAAVLFMVAREYAIEEFDDKGSMSSREVEESKM